MSASRNLRSKPVQKDSTEIDLERAGAQRRNVQPLTEEQYLALLENEPSTSGNTRDNQSDTDSEFSDEWQPDVSDISYDTETDSDDWSETSSVQEDLQALLDDVERPVELPLANDDNVIEQEEGVGAEGQWKKYEIEHEDFTKFRFTVQNPGPQYNRQPNTELEYFALFFTDELFLEILSETNRYAKEKIQMVTPLSKYSIWSNWKEVDLKELKAFIGVILNMGLNPKPDLKDYFSEEWVDYMPFFKNTFSRNRFLQIFWCLHLCPPPPIQPSGIALRGSKVRNVVNHIDKKCRENFIPYQHIAIDESTIAFKGRVQFKCYNPKKPSKWGLRIYVLADSSTGYISAIVPYFGKTTTEGLVRPELPFTSRIVLHLLDMLLPTTNGSGFHLYTDRFYTGPNLASELLDLNIHLTGTVMTNRSGLPEEIRKPKLKLHEVLAYQKNDQIMALAFKDKRIVTMCSTYHNAHTQLVRQRKKKGGEILDVNKPIVICDYTKQMGAVDRADHYIASYAFARKSFKWWRKLFFWLLEVSVVNSYILYSIDTKKNNAKPVSHKKFRKQLLTQLVGDVRNKEGRKRGRPSAQDQEERLDGRQHFIMHLEGNKHKDCAVCSNRKVPGGRRETVYICETCTRKPGLHVGVCFKKYHTLTNYK